MQFNSLHSFVFVGYIIYVSDLPMEKKDFITPPNHIRFLAKKLFGEAGEIKDGSIAYLQPQGGGPIEKHTHETDHLFIVVKGEAKVLLGEKTKIIRENESFLVKGNIPHSVWNNSQEETTMIGITIQPQK
ncbi:MAG: cupin domain-containing protein [Candidatus Azobacteroides sp.]|nr:cupin domain-containing protein [Candidatus Azobacteroides sp.]